MSEPGARPSRLGGGAALRIRDFRLFWLSSVATGLALSMSQVAVGWQVYELRGNPLDLGLVGLAEFLPLPLLALPAGHLADRLPRRSLFAVATVIDLPRSAGCSSSRSSGRARSGRSCCSPSAPGSRARSARRRRVR